MTGITCSGDHACRGSTADGRHKSCEAGSAGTRRQHGESWEHAAGVDHNPMYALVVAGGAIDAAERALVKRASLVVAADSGAEFLRQHNLTPDMIVGDFDSASPDTIACFRGMGISIFSLNRDKDKTDTEVALDLVTGKGFDAVIIIGGTRGRRLDHELANVFLIEHYARKGLDLILHSQDTVIFGIPGGEVQYGNRRRMQKRVFTGKPGDWVTILPVTPQVTGATTVNLKFPLSNATLYRGSTLGVSNEMLNTEASVSLKSGFALVVLNRR
ncbi:MAG TPA: thiamine diphosphokinase [Firmicutes bacterium]|nr:thiamine diphosphokinase [Candidatus Fermentithermobacillaceae bacterium]